MKKTIVHSAYEIEVDHMVPQDMIKTMPKYKRFLDLARVAALMSDFERTRIGTVITIQGKVVARGFNSSKTHPLQKKQNTNRIDVHDDDRHNTHSEISALNNAKDQDLSKAEIFVYHLGKNGVQKMARPCAGCMDLIKKRGIKTIHYSTPDGFATEYIRKNIPIKVKRAKRDI